MLRILFSALILITILSNCQSKINRVTKESNELCVGSFESTGWTLEIPPEMKALAQDQITLKGKNFVLVSRFNVAVVHAQDLSRCAKSRECLIKELRREYDCEREFVQNISNWVPFAFQGRKECSIPESDCVTKY